MCSYDTAAAVPVNAVGADTLFIIYPRKHRPMSLSMLRRFYSDSRLGPTQKCGFGGHCVVLYWWVFLCIARHICYAHPVLCSTCVSGGSGLDVAVERNAMQPHVILRWCALVVLAGGLVSCH